MQPRLRVTGVTRVEDRQALLRLGAGRRVGDRRVGGIRSHTHALHGLQLAGRVVGAVPLIDERRGGAIDDRRGRVGEAPGTDVGDAKLTTLVPTADDAGAAIRVATGDDVLGGQRLGAWRDERGSHGGWSGRSWCLADLGGSCRGGRGSRRLWRPLGNGGRRGRHVAERSQPA